MTNQGELPSGKGVAIGHALKGRCPRCGHGRLFTGPLKLGERCGVCGLDYGDFNVGDGPAAFAIFIVGTIIAVGALWLDMAVRPPWWVHALVWVPTLVVLTILSLHFIKAALLGSEYANQAREGRRSDDG